MLARSTTRISPGRGRPSRCRWYCKGSERAKRAANRQGNGRLIAEASTTQRTPPFGGVFRGLPPMGNSAIGRGPRPRGSCRAGKRLAGGPSRGFMGTSRVPWWLLGERTRLAKRSGYWPPLGMTGKHPRPRQSRGHPGEAQSRKKFSKIRPDLKFGYDRSEPANGRDTVGAGGPGTPGSRGERPIFILDGAVPQGLIIASA